MTGNVVKFPTNRRHVADAIDLRQLDHLLNRARDAKLDADQVYYPLLLRYWRAHRVNPCESALREAIPGRNARKKWRQEQEIVIREGGDTSDRKREQDEEFVRLVEILVANRHRFKKEDFDARFEDLAESDPASRDLVEALRRRIFDCGADPNPAA